MCGLAGYLCRGAAAEASGLERMAQRLAHRGPDDQGRHLDGPLGLAQTRLSIIGLDSGHQPMVSADGHLVLAANGEIYNYIELQAELRAAGRRFQTGSDSETLLHAYAVYGLDFLSRLRGMYAFALWDGATRQLILARDRLGIKPLFYARLPDRIAFASEIKALLPVLPTAPEVAPRALRQFLQHQFSSGRETPIAGIVRVLPGEALIINDRLRIRPWRYWSLRTCAPRRLGAEQAEAELDVLLREAMREHQRSDVPFGLFLSGGMDSAVLAALLAEHGGGGLRAWSVGYGFGSTASELAEAGQIAAHFGLDHTPLELGPAEVFARLPHSIWAADDLMRDYACLPTSILAETAARERKVVFSGEGGDEVFAGYRRYRPGFPERWFKRVAVPGSGGFRTRGQWPGSWIRRLFGPELIALAAVDRAPFRQAWSETPASWSDLARRQYTDLVTALPDNLMVKTDRMLMGFGLEGRVPFLDHRIVEFGLSLPDELKVRGRQGKWLLRQWAEWRLPPGYLQRPKRGFHVPVGDWLRDGQARRLATRLPRNRGIRTWFRAAAVAELAAAVAAGQRLSRPLWGLMQFAIWHRLFIESPGLPPSPNEDPLDWVASDS